MNSEITVHAISAMLTAWTAVSCIKYMVSLHREVHRGHYIYGDELHSLQHFATSGVMVLVSLLIFSESVFHANFPMQFLVTLSYNLMITMIILPHLIYEK